MLPPSAAPYEAYAALYDRTGQSRFGLKMTAYALEILALWGLKPKRVADVGCGTGAVAVALASRRFEVVGIDGSPAMLARARERAARRGVAVDWRCQDLREADPGAPVDFLSCYYDTLNHLTEPGDLELALGAFHRALAPGGLALVDLNTPHAYASVWNGATDVFDDGELTRIWRSRYDAGAGLATLEATYFERAGELWRRHDFTHHARGYAPEAVKAAFRGAGFGEVVAYEALSFERPGPESYRVAYVARA